VGGAENPKNAAELNIESEAHKLAKHLLTTLERNDDFKRALLNAYMAKTILESVSIRFKTGHDLFRYKIYIANKDTVISLEMYENGASRVTENLFISTNNRDPVIIHTIEDEDQTKPWIDNYNSQGAVDGATGLIDKLITL